MAAKTEPKTPLNAFYFHEPFTQHYWADILEELYKKQVYLKFLPHKKRSVCIDVGANVGLCTYYFSKYFGKVYALEPSLLHLEALHAMTDKNKLTNVEVVPLALSNQNGTAKFYHNDNTTMFSLESSVNKPNDFEEVETITMDKFMEDYKLDHIDLMKLDVEGMEGKIVNSEGFKRVADKIKVIIFEYHSWSGISKDNFQHSLENLGYTVHWRWDVQASVGEAIRI